MKVKKILEVQQPRQYKNLTNNEYKKKHKKRKKEKLSFGDVVNLMKHDSYTRSKRGSIKQKTWGK